MSRSSKDKRPFADVLRTEDLFEIYRSSEDRRPFTGVFKTKDFSQVCWRQDTSLWSSEDKKTEDKKTFHRFSEHKIPFTDLQKTENLFYVFWKQNTFYQSSEDRRYFTGFLQTFIRAFLRPCTRLLETADILHVFWIRNTLSMPPFKGHLNTVELLQVMGTEKTFLRSSEDSKSLTDTQKRDGQLQVFWRQKIFYRLSVGRHNFKRFSIYRSHFTSLLNAEYLLQVFCRQIAF